MPKTKCFDENYSEYEDWFERNKYVYLSELKAVRQFIPNEGKGLEVGVGSGKFAVPLGIKTGVEPSKNMKKLAEEKGLKVYEGVAELLPFEDSSFDFVLMVTTICFVDDINKSFCEVKRVLKENGLFIIGFVDKDSPLGKIYESKKDRSVFYKDAIFYSVKEILSILRENNFDNTEVIQTIFGKLPEINKVQRFKEGFGEGGFAVIKAVNSK